MSDKSKFEFCPYAIGLYSTMSEIIDPCFLMCLHCLFREVAKLPPKKQNDFKELLDSLYNEYIKKK